MYNHEDHVDKLIQNLSPLYKKELLSILNELISHKNSDITKTIKEFKKNKNFIAVARSTSRYWTQRGWSIPESLEKRGAFKRHRISPMQVNFWLEKINPDTDLKYTYQEAKDKIASQRSFNIKYWLKRGFSEQDASKKVSEVQFKNGNKLSKKLKENPENYESRSTMQLKYWIKKYGLSEDEARIKLSKRQNILSLDKFIERYGEEDGRNKYVQMCEKVGRRNTLEYKIEQFGEEEGLKKYKEIRDKITFSKTLAGFMKRFGESEGRKKFEEHKQRLCDRFTLESFIKRYGEDGKNKYDKHIENRSFAASLEGYISRHGEEEGIKRRNERYSMHAREHNVSKESINFFIPIYKELRKYLERKDIFWGIDGSQEWFVYDNSYKKIFWYDFAIPKHKLIIEYHGVRYHPNPRWDKETWNRWRFYDTTADEKRTIDIFKNDMAIEHGFEVVEIWSDEVKTFDIDFIINKIKKI